MDFHKSSLLIQSNNIPNAALPFLNLTSLCEWNYLTPSNNNCIFDTTNLNDVLKKGDVEIDYNYNHYISVLESNVMTLSNDNEDLLSDNAKLEIDLFNLRNQYSDMRELCTENKHKLMNIKYSLNSFQSILNSKLPEYKMNSNTDLNNIKTKIIKDLDHIVLFENCDYTGKRLELSIGKYNKITFGNIAIIPPNIKVILYSDEDFKGKEYILMDAICILNNYNSAIIEPIII